MHLSDLVAMACCVACESNVISMCNTPWCCFAPFGKKYICTEREVAHAGSTECLILHLALLIQR